MKIKDLGNNIYEVDSEGGNGSYEVDLKKKTCTCKGFTLSKSDNPGCKHLNLAKDTYGAVDVPSQNNSTNNDNDQEVDRIPDSIDERFIQKIGNKPFVVYAGLLDLGHQKGIKSFTVKVIQYPKEENGKEAICEATLIPGDGGLYIDYGDANPKNVSKMVAGHELRMASTRAKARVLRDYTNVGITCLEELGNVVKTPSEKKLDELYAIMKKKLSKDISNDQRKVMHTWITNLSMDDFVYFKNKVEEADTFDWNGYITLKKEIEEMI